MLFVQVLTAALLKIQASGMLPYSGLINNYWPFVEATCSSSGGRGQLEWRA